jgi:hypothetical protein
VAFVLGGESGLKGTWRCSWRRSQVQLLFDLFDISIIPTGTGIGSLALPLRRAATSRPTNRFSHVTLLGGAIASAALQLALLLDVPLIDHDPHVGPYLAVDGLILRR